MARPRFRLEGVAADWLRAEYERYHLAHRGVPRGLVGVGFVSKDEFEKYAEFGPWMLVARDSLAEVIRESWDHTQNGDIACYPSAEHILCVMLPLY
jgi:hypothetical protein